MSLLTTSIKTIVREIKDHVTILVIQIAGFVIIILGVATFLSNKNAIGVAGIFIFVGVVLLVIASYMQKKVRFIAWVREAIELERNKFSKKCPKCTNSMNNIKSNYCSHCGNRI